ncbi:MULTISPECIES: NADH-quinone oxidoreductase subunit NuoG [Rhizobium/Agrobacterium group]|uniref:NADH-quinone oxidoreductase subunit NuoG n=1 Tax=Rhizobium/Agrobacterium group TaxID=227290 RepID=UPI0003F1DB0D|nr:MULTISPECIES: NADH-quinone oxidoreductase subunit NuoG [Rhizobium/Agrobacterium group]AHK01143.1 NADH-ubiquinone oxidoreductase chain G [Agrobacterium tumefaciens LBA4213 (Ach5)]AKC06954.1 NADH ubiquinone oxidoreductase chain G [Agrobacterium tumefaciens]AYM15859.1 NADH ubiquinone oxidoreductase chain G [Agrobacterium tumefaciens]AYM67094.1 NADH ubiquinone oxidoreductase chain G [Agrobacterium tumefaciens]NIB54691.1 NADH-quinone oxidoreductase subunit G [Agrobacterium tumefaciens]
MAKLKVDGKEIEVPDHFTLLQACEEAGAEVPRFCFHERLSVAGNCRMCLIEVKGGPPKPAASCAMGVRDVRGGPNGELPEVFTNTPMVKKAREGVMEFLLINHPLDCPICDQGGECDLQDQAMAFGIAGSRYAENKRAVEDKYIGPLVKTVMNRCIHCTRCVRFTTEVAGIAELGLIGRGEDAEITTYLEQAMTSELQGNVVDLCPVGALTSKPFAFTARPWELNKTETIDVMDALGSAIRVDTRGREVMRVMPRVNEAINEEWISDKSRFIWDGLKTQRLDRPYVRKDGRLQPASWGEAFGAIKQAVAATSGSKIGAIAGDLASVEEMFALKSLLASLGSANVDCRQDGAALDPSLGRASYLFNSTIEGIEHADALLIVGANPRYEAAVLNARIRKRWRRGGFPIGVIGEAGELRYNYEYLGSGAETLSDIANGSHSFIEKLKSAKNPLIIIGQGALARADGAAVLAAAAKLAVSVGAISEEWNGFSVLHTAAARVGGLDIGFVPGEGGVAAAEMVTSMDVLFLLGADEIDLSNKGAKFTVYIGSHGDHGAMNADVILPGAAYTEKPGIWVNTEGRVQVGNRAGFAPGEAREDWAILRALSDVLGKKLPFDSLSALRGQLYVAHPHLAETDEIVAGNGADVEALAARAGSLNKSAFASPVKDFYLTNPIARASAVMAECSALARNNFQAAAE